MRNTCLALTVLSPSLSFIVAVVVAGVSAVVVVAVVPTSLLFYSYVSLQIHSARSVWKCTDRHTTVCTIRYENLYDSGKLVLRVSPAWFAYVHNTHTHTHTHARSVGRSLARNIQLLHACNGTPHSPTDSALPFHHSHTRSFSISLDIYICLANSGVTQPPVVWYDRTMFYKSISGGMGTARSLRQQPRAPTIQPTSQMISVGSLECIYRSNIAYSKKYVEKYSFFFGQHTSST